MTKSKIRIVPTGLLLLGMVLIAVGLFLAVASQSSGLEVRCDSSDLGQISSMSEHHLALSCRNASPSVIHILGGTAFCTKTGCGALRTKLPLEIAAGETVPFTVDFRAGEPGPFSTSYRFFTDAPGQAIITVTVHGRITPTTGEKPAPPLARLR